MDEEAKVRAHAVLDGGAGIDEAFQAVSPWFVFPVAVGLVQRATVTVHVHGVGLLGAVVGVVGQEDSDDAVTPSLESGEVAGVVEVVADKFSSTRKGVIHPHTSVVVRVAVSLFLFGRNHTWSARMAVGRQEGVYP